MFEDFVRKRWHEQDFVRKVAEGYQESVFRKYGEALEGFEMMEKRVMGEDKRLKKSNGVKSQA